MSIGGLSPFQLNPMQQEAAALSRQMAGGGGSERADRSRGAENSGQAGGPQGRESHEKEKQQRIRLIQAQIDMLRKQLESIEKEYLKMLQAGPKVEGELRANRLRFMQDAMEGIMSQIAQLTQQMAMLAAGGQQGAQGVQVPQGVRGGEALFGATAPQQQASVSRLNVMG